MNVLKALILSVVEGVTEFLPISSTGHLILSARLLSIPQTEFVKSFEIIIQLGAIAAVLVLYVKKLFANTAIIPKLLVAFLPTATIGFVLYKLIKTYLLGNVPLVVLALGIGGVVLIAIEKFSIERTGSIQALSFPQALLIGLAQTVSIIPGVSRSAATILGGMVCGLSRKEAVEFSFLLALPTMIAATGLDLLKTGMTFSASEIQLLVLGLCVSFCTALISVKWLVGYVETHTFILFGIYRIALSLVFAFFFLT